MVCGLVLGMSLAAPVAIAQDPPVSPEAAQAEYVRLSREMQSRAERNAWSGVERTYQAILANGVPPSQEDHLLAARAAKQAGDAKSVRDRLALAIELGENLEAYDWAWEFDSSYGRVELAADVGTHELVPAAMPFQPDLSASVRFAQAQLQETGTFNGFLPQGNYTFGPYTIEVMPRVQTVQIDARGSVPVERPEREARPPRPEREPRERDVRPEREPRPERVRPVRAPREPADPTGREEVAKGHLFAVTAGLGNRYGGGIGGGINGVLRVPVDVIGFGLSAGVGYDVVWAAAGYHVGGRLYLPAIVSGLSSATFFLGGGWSPMVYLQDSPGVNRTVSQELHATPIGLDIRLGQFVIDASFEFTRVTGFGDEVWFAGYGVGVGFGFP